MAKIIRDRDGEGYFGSRVEVIDERGISPWSGKSKDLIGKQLRVGTMTAGMFSSRDWWQTTTITKILSATPDSIRFETGNSKYTLER